MENYRRKIKSVFISERNAEKFLVNPKHHPILIYIIFDKSLRASDDIFKAIYDYSLLARCPLCVSGSRNHLSTVAKYAKGAVIQRVNTKVMLHIIKKLCKIANDTPEGAFSLFKTRFNTVSIIYECASSAAFLDNKVSKSSPFFRTVTLSEKADATAYEHLSHNNLSGIISDCALNENTLYILNKTPVTPLILTGKSGILPRNVKAHRIDINNASSEISDILDNHIKKRSKFLYIKNK